MKNFCPNNNCLIIDSPLGMFPSWNVIISSCWLGSVCWILFSLFIHRLTTLAHGIWGNMNVLMDKMMSWFALPVICWKRITFCLDRLGSSVVTHSRRLGDGTSRADESSYSILQIYSQNPSFFFHYFPLFLKVLLSPFYSSRIFLVTHYLKYHVFFTGIILFFQPAQFSF